MQCPGCNQNLLIANSHPISENEEIKIIQTLVCINQNCDLYAGKNLNKPNKIAKIIKNDW